MINFLEQAEKIISISSVSEDGNEEIAQYLYSLMRSQGYKTILQEVTHSLEGVSRHQYNVLGILGDPLVDRKTKKGLMLSSHTDTVSPGIKSYWTETDSDPFKATIRDGKIFGLGSADVKLDFLCKLKACEKYHDRRLKMPLYLVGTAGEEIGMIGAKFLIKSLAVNPKFILVGEPSDLAIINAHKATLTYELQISYNERERDAKGFNTRVELHAQGKSAHGSYPQLGDNAIKKILLLLRKIKTANFQMRVTKLRGGDLVNKVPDTASAEFFISSGVSDDFRAFFNDNMSDPNIKVEFGGLGESGMKFSPDNIVDAIEDIQVSVDRMESDVLSQKDESYNPSGSTANFGRLVQRADGVSLFYDIRLLPSISADLFDQKLKASLQATNVRFPNLIIQVSRRGLTPALNTDKNSELVKAALGALKIAGSPPRLDKKSTGTEAAHYSLAGFDSIVFGPGKSMGNSHSPNEHNIIDQLDRAVHFYDKMIERFCL